MTDNRIAQALHAKAIEIAAEMVKADPSQEAKIRGRLDRYQPIGEIRTLEACFNCGLWHVNIADPASYMCPTSTERAGAANRKSREVWLNGPFVGHEVGKEPPPTPEEIRQAVEPENQIRAHERKP